MGNGQDTGGLDATWPKPAMMSVKRIPPLVPYKELPESEKEYDRSTATETLKAILALGYQIIDLQEDNSSGENGV